MGVRGSGLATALSFTVGMALALFLLASGRLRLRIGWHDLVLHRETIRRVLQIGYPAAAEQLLMQFGFFLYLLFAARYGTDAVAAYFIGVRILALSFLPGFGFAAAAAALVGQNLGAGLPKRAQTAGWHATWMSVALMSTTGVVISFFAEDIAHFFVDTPAVVAGTVSFIHMLAISQPLMAMDFTIGAAQPGRDDEDHRRRRDRQHHEAEKARAELDHLRLHPERRHQRVGERDHGHDHHRRQHGRHDDRLSEDALRLVEPRRTDRARHQSERAGADRRHRHRHAAEDLRAGADGRDRGRAEARHEQHVDEPDQRLRQHRDDDRPGERPDDAARVPDRAGARRGTVAGEEEGARFGVHRVLGR